jgi:hypothetical protein
MYVLVPNGSGIATAAPGRQAPLAAASVNGGEQGLLLTAVMAGSGPGGTPVSIIGLSDNFDNIAPLTGAFVDLYQGAVARLTGYDATGNNWDRLRTAPDNADGQAALALGVLAELARMQGWNGATWDRVKALADNADGQAANAVGALLALARTQGWNGATWDRLKTLSAANVAAFSGVGALMSAGPGEWAIQQTPAAATQATITRAAGGAGVRHVCRSITCSILATAAQGQIIVNLRDGATGVGTILWSAQFALAAGTSDRLPLTGLNIVGSANTAMTLETAAAPAATNFASVALSGYSTS